MMLRLSKKTLARGVGFYGVKCLFVMLFFTVTAYAQTYRVEDNGGSPALASNTAAIQATLEQASAGGTVTITTPGTYLLTPQGDNPYYAGHKYCLLMAHDNVMLFVGPGVALKLADNQQSAAPIDIIVFEGRNNLTFDGQGEINGNSFNQGGWSGGYSQVDHGIIISGSGSSAKANSNITIKHLTLRNHFSNPINIDAGFFGLRNNNIRISNVTAVDCGEGIQVITSDDVWIIDCEVTSPNHVAVGDAIEVSDVNGFHLSGNTVKNHWYGSAFDIYGSKNGTVENFVVDDCINGVDVHYSFVGSINNPQNILTKNGTITNPRNSTGTGTCDGLEAMGPILNNITFRDIQVHGTPFTIGIQTSAEGGAKTAGPVIIENCEVTNAALGILVAVPISDLTIRGGSYSNNVVAGIVLQYGDGLAAADVRNLTIENLSATNNGQFGVFINNQGFSVPLISGRINNLTLSGNSSPIVAGREGGGLDVDNITPNSKTEFGGGAGAMVFGVRNLCPTGSDVSSFQNPSKNQRLTIMACQERNIIDARQGGVNIYLTSGQNAHLHVGDRLDLHFDSLTGRWFQESPTVTPRPPNLSTEADSDVALTLNATTFVRGPFSAFTNPNFSQDQRTRIMLFVPNLDVLPGEDLSGLSVQAEDSLSRTYTMPVEYVGPVANLGSLTQINVRIPEELANVNDAWVWVTWRGVVGAKARLVLRPN
jgi:hypothetical protein